MRVVQVLWEKNKGKPYGASAQIENESIQMGQEKLMKLHHVLIERLFVLPLLVGTPPHMGNSFVAKYILHNPMFIKKSYA